MYPEINKKYKHYKGGVYEVITLAIDKTTDKPVVVYKSELFGTYYTRPLEQWFDEILEQKCKRFELYEK
jgi:hypothetical protein